MYENFTLFARKITHWILGAKEENVWSLDHRAAPAEFFSSNNSSKTGFFGTQQRRDNDGFLLGMRAVSYIDE